MRPMVQFATLRLIVIALAVLSQVYLFIRIRDAIRASRRSALFKSLSIRVAGLTIVTLFTLNLYLMARPIP